MAARVQQLLTPPAHSGADPVTGPGTDPDGEDDGDEWLLPSAPPTAQRPAWWRRIRARVPIRLDPGRRAALAVGVAVLAAALLTGLWMLAVRPRALAVPAAPVAGAQTVGPGAATEIRSTPDSAVPPPGPTAPPAVVVVDVAGRVRHPGLYRLPSGARIDDAVRAAGGALAGVDLASLNLAARVVDGQQILVGVAPAIGPLAAPGGSGAGPAGPSAGPANGASAGPVDVNTAALEQLETLPGVGPVLGQHILDWRAAHGRFATVDQLLDVTGIGPAKFAALRGLVSV